MSAIKITAPYYSQRDSEVPGFASRMCFSSCVAMLVEHLRPGTLQRPGRQPDDVYLRHLLQFGDTVDGQAHVRALRALGLESVSRYDLGWDDLDRQLGLGVPVPVGILHHGPITAPTGGHRILVIGRTEDGSGYLVHDPWGELDLLSGRYISTQGANLAYSRRNLAPRWLREGPRSGWGLMVEPPERAVPAPVPLLVVLGEGREVHLPFMDIAGLSMLRTVLERLQKAGQPITVGWSDRDGGRLYLRPRKPGEK